METVHHDSARFGNQLIGRGDLPADDREYLILRTAFRCEADYEWWHHRDIALQIGLSVASVESARAELPGR